MVFKSYEHKCRKLKMVGAIILGAISGVLGFIPLIFGLRMTRRVTQTSNFGHAAILLLSILASIVVLAVTATICILFARDLVLGFTVAEALGLSVSAIVFGLYRLVGKDTRKG